LALQKGEIADQEGDWIRLAGRVLSKRSSGNHLMFLDLSSNGSRLQIVLSKNRWNQSKESNQIEFDDLTRLVKRGDIVGVQGHAGRTRTGQLSLWAESLRLLSPCLRIIPHVHYGLKDDEQRARHRHLDLTLNSDVFARFQKRFKVIGSLRSVLSNRGFVEVETPILHRTPAGGATARPFQTHHTALGMQMDLRIAPELHLKRLLVGGFEKVFELGRVFRNEGLDRTHNPEFTLCEYYAAYEDYEAAAAQLQIILNEIATQVTGSSRVAMHVDSELEVEVDFSLPFERIDVWSEIERQLSTRFPNESLRSLLPAADQLDDESAHRQLSSLCDRLDITFGVDEQQRTAAHCVEKLIEHLVESGVDRSKATLLMHHPVICSPLARVHRDRAGLSERFELFVAGFELANGYSELTDPTQQRQAFERQASRGSTVPDADLDYVRALEYAMPPAAGVGIGVDRLVMLLTGTGSMREVILFPTLRPEHNECDAK
jgi:lysyl-tRNA synthetase class 2